VKRCEKTPTSGWVTRRYRAAVSSHLVGVSCVALPICQHDSRTVESGLGWIEVRIEFVELLVGVAIDQITRAFCFFQLCQYLLTRHRVG